MVTDATRSGGQARALQRRVAATVVEQGKGEKVIVFKYRAKERCRRRRSPAGYTAPHQ
jgi:ribosomal protein L21